MMDMDALRRRLRDILKRLGPYRHVLLVIAAGAILLLWPSGEGKQRSGSPSDVGQEDGFQTAALEEQISEILSRIEGAGKVSVMLTVKSGVERVLAQDTELSQNGRSSETVVISGGSGKQEVVVLTERYPVFQGALVVCPGGEDARVRLQIAQALSALTGLSSGRISICKGN